MKAFTVITIIALVLLVGGGVTAGLIAASEQAPSELPPQAVIPLADHPQVDAPVETVRPMQASVAVQQSEVETPDSDQGRGLTAKPAATGDGDGQCRDSSGGYIYGAKANPQPPTVADLTACFPDGFVTALGEVGSAGVDQEPDPVERSVQQARSKEEGDAPGTVYTWEDGDRTLQAVLQSDLVVQENAAITPEDEVVQRGAKDSIVRKQVKHGSDVQPVFRSGSGGGLMTLPGGVVLVLDPGWDQDAVESFFSWNGLSLEPASELDFLENAFLVETDPGFPSMELANALAGQDGVIVSSPNWSRETELR